MEGNIFINLRKNWWTECHGWGRGRVRNPLVLRLVYNHLTSLISPQTKNIFSWILDLWRKLYYWLICLHIKQLFNLIIVLFIECKDDYQVGLNLQAITNLLRKHRNWKLNDFIELLGALQTELQSVRADSNLKRQNRSRWERFRNVNRESEKRDGMY